MCIRDSIKTAMALHQKVLPPTLHVREPNPKLELEKTPFYLCLLYTSDAADERSSVDLGGRRIIKKKTHQI